MPHLRTLAPDFAGRFALITAGLVALIARAFLRDPRLAPLILPLCRRINRVARRFAAMMALLALGHLPPPRRGGKSGKSGPRPAIPTAPAWLVATLRHEAAAYASQLSHLLAEPGVSDLLAAVPAAQRLLRPLVRMLGLPNTPPAVAAAKATSTFAVENPAMPPPPCPHVGWPWFSPPTVKPA